MSMRVSFSRSRAPFSYAIALALFAILAISNSGVPVQADSPIVARSPENRIAEVKSEFCLFCGLPLNSGAVKCAECDEWQPSVFRHPVLLAMSMIRPLVIIFTSVATLIFFILVVDRIKRRQASAALETAVSASDPRRTPQLSATIATLEKRDGRWTAIGTLTNRGDTLVNAPSVEAALKDLDGQLLDVGAAFVSGAILPHESRDFAIHFWGNIDSDIEPVCEVKVVPPLTFG